MYRDHINEIKRKSKNRKMAAAITESMDLIKESDADEVIEMLQAKIVEAQAEGHAGMSSAPDIALDIIQGSPEPKILTGFRTLDYVMKGLRKGRVLTIAGRPGTGKTAFCIRILDQLSIKDRAIYFSLEMGEREIIERMLASQTLVKLDKIVEKTFDENEKARLIESRAMQNYNIVIDDSPGLTMKRIAAKARIEKIRNGLSVIFIDHIGLVNPSSSGMKAYERMTEISKGMKELAKELDITVIALSQLNRSPDTRNGGEPLLSDLRDSGSVEQDSDQVILLYNPDYQDKSKEKADANGGCEILMAKIAKNRIGGIGQIQYDYYKATQFIEESRR
jgi:replicative DNA helicase